MIRTHGCVRWVWLGFLPFVLAGCMRGYPRGSMMGPVGFGGVFMWIALILVIAVLVFLVSKSGKSSGDTPAEILKRRYVRGEISGEEYRRMKREIEG